MDAAPAPPLAPGEIHVWFHDVNVAAGVVDDLAAILSAAELAKAQRYRFEADRRRSIVARARLRQHLSEYCGVNPAAVEIRGERDAKPDAPATGIHFNVSHSAGLVGMAFSSERAVGFDVERVRPVRGLAGIVRRYFSADEQQAVTRAADTDGAFFLVWTAKEALVKGTGGGLASGLVGLSVPIGAPTLTPVRTSLPVYAGWRVASVTPPRDDYRAAVAACDSTALIRVLPGPSRQ